MHLTRMGKALMSKDLRMCVGVVIAGFCTFLQIYVTQPLLPQFQRLFAVSALTTSLTVSAVTFAVALASPFVGSLADAVGRKRVIVPAILGLSLPTMLAASATTMNQLIAWRFAQGLFVPGIIAVMLAYIAEEARPGTAAALNASYVAGTVLGGMCGRFFAAFIAAYLDWRWAFVLLGIMTASGGGILWLCLPASRHFVRQRNPFQSLRAMGGHLRNKRLVATYFVGFNGLFTLVGIFTYANFYLAGEPFHLGLVALGSVFLVYGLGLLVTPAAGLWTDRVGYRLALIAAATTVGVGALLTLIPRIEAVILGLAVLSSGSFVIQSAASSHVGAVAREARSSAAGLYVCFYYIGGSVGTTLLGLLWRWHGWPVCILCVVLMQCISIAVTLRFFVAKRTAHATGESMVSLNAKI